MFRKARFLDRNEINHVKLDDGTELTVSAAALSVQRDGSFLLDDAVLAQAGTAPSEPEPRPETREPQLDLHGNPDRFRSPVREAMTSRLETISAGAAIEDVYNILDRGWPPAPSVAAAEPYQQPVLEEQVVQTMPNKTDEAINISDPLFTEDVQVERVPVNRILNGPVEVRQEGDVTIVPVIEEVITVQKRLLLREEIRITRRRTEKREPRRILLDDGDVRTYGADGREIETRE